jgi:hypothetical protein
MAEISATSNPLSQVALSACEFDVPPEVFGVLVDNRLFFAAVKATSGDVSGLFSYSQSVEGESFNFAGRITCMHLYDFDGGTLNRAKLGGVVDWTDDETIPVGTFIWWQTIDNRLSPGNLHDKSTLSGFGDEAANEAFCNSPDPPRFGPWERGLSRATHARLYTAAPWRSGYRSTAAHRSRARRASSRSRAGSRRRRARATTWSWSSRRWASRPTS